MFAIELNINCQDTQSSQSSSFSDSEDISTQSSGRDLELSSTQRAYTPAALYPVVILPTSILYYNNSMNNSRDYDKVVSFNSDITPSQEHAELKEEQLKPHDSETVNADISSRPWDWAQSPEFIPNMKCQLTDPDASADQNTQIQMYPTYQPRVPISYADAAKAYTWDSWGCSTYDQQDVSSRYEQCDMCMEMCLDSSDTDQQKAHRCVCTAKIEQEMEDAFAYQRSEGKACAICYEEVISKPNYSERRFGILLGCLHVFCLSCIRKWRTKNGGDKNAVRSCPLCRTHSDYVIPSVYWVDETEDKVKLIDQYQKKLSNIACRYFDEGKGSCPFGNNCFYMHAFPNGDVHKEKIRKYGNSEGEVTIIQPVSLSQFIQERENRGLS